VAVAGAGEAAQSPAEEGRLGALFDAHHRRLFRLACRMCRSSDAARDLVQETFLRAARAGRSVPVGAAAEEAWLVRVLVNLCKDAWRKRAARNRLDVARWPDPPSHPEAALIARRVVWQALESLAPRRRAAVVLYELEGVAIPDIATLLGVTAVTVRWHLSRGRRELARAIADSAGKPRGTP
jgi:RNA polymerase sigma-70 factor (ECF subfamily)